MESPLKSYYQKKKISEIEENLPEVFYTASALTDYSSFEEMIKIISENSTGAISQEFSNAYNEIGKGESFENAMKNICIRNKSEIIEKAIEVLIIAYETGADVSECLFETAEEMSKIIELKKEQSAILVIEKTTLLVASMLIIPLVLGMLSNVITQTGFDLPDEISSVSSETREAFSFYTSIGNHLYIIILGIISGLFISDFENSSEKRIFYPVLMPIVGLAVFRLSFLL